MLVMVIANLLGAFSFLFLMWLKLKEDYHYERIFNLSFTTLVVFFISSIISVYYIKEYWFWINFMGLLIGFISGIILFKFKFYESFNAFVVAVMPFLGFYFLFVSVYKFSLPDFVSFWIITIFIFLYFFIDSNYRKITWYKSGRVGFSGLFISGTFFLIRAILAYYYPSSPSIVGIYDIYISASFAFLFFLLLFNLSRKSL